MQIEILGLGKRFTTKTRIKFQRITVDCWYSTICGFRENAIEEKLRMLRIYSLKTNGSNTGLTYSFSTSTELHYMNMGNFLTVLSQNLK
jgi:hypothetical protein